MDQLKASPPNSCPLTPLTFLEREALVYGDCTSIVYHSTTYTWSQTHTRCLRVASAILSLGIELGSVVSVVAPNVPAMYELQFAVPMSGCVLNNINTRLDSRNVSLILSHSELKLVFVYSSLHSLVLQVISMFPPNVARPGVIVIDREDSGPGIVGERTGKTYEGMVLNGNPAFQWIWPKNEWDPITLNYTSGTTSSPKGVVHSHRAIFIITFDSLWSVPKQPVYLWTLPMFHSNGWSYTWGMAAVGGTNVCLEKFDARVVYTSISRYNVTHMCGAPVILNMLANYPGARPLKAPVQYMTGGTPPPAAVILRTESLGFNVSHGFGMTEVAGVVISCEWKSKWNAYPATDRAKLKARQGVRTLGLTEADVDPKSGIRVKRDGISIGETVLRGGCLMFGNQGLLKGYYYYRGRECE